MRDGPRRCPYCKDWFPSWLARAKHLCAVHGWTMKKPAVDKAA
jgi:uncharacterized C2H2 Zn-finger protein